MFLVFAIKTTKSHSIHKILEITVSSISKRKGSTILQSSIHFSNSNSSIAFYKKHTFLFHEEQTLSLSQRYCEHKCKFYSTLISINTGNVSTNLVTRTHCNSATVKNGRESISPQTKIRLCSEHTITNICNVSSNETAYEA